METLFQDLRFGIRLLLKNPGFSAVAILALALGIGANTAIFSVVDAVLFKPLPFDRPERLMAVWERNLTKGEDHDSVMAANYLDWRDRSQVFEQMSAHAGGSVNLTGLGQPERLHVQLVTWNAWRVLGVQPTIGRAFTDEEDKTGAAVTLAVTVAAASIARGAVNFLAVLVTAPAPLLIVVLVGGFTAIAAYGVRESVGPAGF